MSGAGSPKIESTAALLHTILAAGATHATNTELAKRANLSPRSVDNVLKYLRERDLVRTPPARLGAGWGAVLSISLGAAGCRAGLVDANGTVFHEHSEPSLPDQTKLPPDSLLKRIVRAGHRVIETAYREGDLLVDGQLPVLGVATAWPCPVRGSKRVVGSVLHRDWLAYDPPLLTHAVADAFGIDRKRSHALNRGNAHALAIAFDSARQRPDLRDHSEVAFYLRLGGGIGFSTMILNPGKEGRLSFVDSALIGGARNMAGQLAHVSVSPSLVDELNERGRLCSGLAPLSLDSPCSCGQPGHLEALAGGAAFLKRMKASGVAHPEEMVGTTNDLTDALAAFDLQDERVRYALEDIGRLVGRALVAPVLVLDPSVLTLSGSFAVPLVIQGVLAERETWRHSFGDGLTINDIDGSDSAYLGVRGAALAVHRALVYRRFEELIAADPTAEGLTMTWPEPRALASATH